MKVFITARGMYQVQNVGGYALNQFTSLSQANSFIRQQGQTPIYTWIN